MSFDTPPSKAPALALTSMLDVIFLLLCFFVTVSVFSQWESEIAIQLPSAETAREPERLPGEIIVNLAKDGTVRVNGATWTHDERASRSSIPASRSSSAPTARRPTRSSSR